MRYLFLELSGSLLLSEVPLLSLPHGLLEVRPPGFLLLLILVLFLLGQSSPQGVTQHLRMRSHYFEETRRDSSTLSVPVARSWTCLPNQA